MASEELLTYMAGQEGGGGSRVGMDGILELAALGLIFGDGFGGFGGGNGGQAVTRAELYDGFATQNIDSAVRNVQNGISDSTYALTGALNSGFSSAALGRCQDQAAIMAQLNAMQAASSACCCETQRAIEGVKYTIAQEGCDTRRAIADSTRDIVDSGNANTRLIMDYLAQSRYESLNERYQQVLSDNATLRSSIAADARINAQTEELLRRSGHSVPQAAYVVDNPHCCTRQGWGGCGCGC